MIEEENRIEKASRTSRALPWWLALVAAAASLLFHGYGFGLQNQHIQIPHLKALNDPGLYPGDPLMEAMGSYFSFFWPALAWLARTIPLEPLFFVGHVLAVFFRYAALATLARILFPKERWAPALAVWLVFFGHSGIGYESLNWSYFTHTPVATALGLWALCAVFAGRWVLGLFVAGVIFNLQAMQSAYVLLMIGAAAVFELRAVWKRLLVGGIVYFAAAAPGLAWMLSVSALEAPPDLMALIRAWFPFHFFPSTFGPLHWAAVAIFLAMWAGTWWLQGTPAVRRARWMCAGIFGFWLLGGLAMELRPSSLWLKLHVFRSSAYLCFVLFALWGGVLARGARWALGRGVPAYTFAVGLMLVALPGSYEFLDLADPVLLGAAGIAAVGVLLAWFAPPALARGAGAVGLAGAGLAFTLLWSARAGLPGVERKPKWRDVQEWARANTDRSARFLVPPHERGFRVFSERSIVGDVQDGSALLWSTEYADYWRAWYLDMGGAFDGADVTCWDRLARAWSEMDAPRLEAIARKYGADYVVLRTLPPEQAARGAGPAWDAPAVYENGAFAVYPVRR